MERRRTSTGARVALAAAAAAASLLLGFIALRGFQIGVIRGFRFPWWLWGLGVAVASSGAIGAVVLLEPRGRPPTGRRAVLLGAAGVAALTLLHLPLLWATRLRGVYMPGPFGDDLVSDTPIAQVLVAFALGLCLAIATASAGPADRLDLPA